MRLAVGIVTLLCLAPGLAGAGLRLRENFRPSAPPPIVIARGSTDGRSSPVVLARAGKRDVVLVADPDSNEVDAFDAANAHLLARQTVAGGPSHLLLDRNAHLWVTARDANVVREYDLEGDAFFPDIDRRGEHVDEAPGDRSADRKSMQLLSLRREIETDVEPLAMALTDDDATLLVASGWGHSLAGFATATGARTFSVDLPREPRGVAIAGDRAFVSHATGSLASVVDLSGNHAAKSIALRGDEGVLLESRGNARAQEALFGFGFGWGELDDSSSSAAPSPPPNEAKPKKMSPRFATQGFAVVAAHVKGRDRVLFPEVLARPGEMPEVKLGEPRPTGYGSFGAEPLRSFGTETAHVAVVDPRTDLPTPASMTLTVDDRDCLLPRAAVVDASRGTLLVACVGTDKVVELDVDADTAGAHVLARYLVPSGPTGLAVDGERLYVWSAFDRMLTIVTRAMDANASFASATKARSPSPYEVGQKIFHASGSLALSNDGRACASCHPDGRDDGLTWASPDGPRQTPMLAGRLRESAPFGWTDGSRTVHDHLEKTIARLGGQGMDEAAAYALMSYLASMRVPTRHEGNARDPKIARGKQLFSSYEVGCSSCHESKEKVPTGDGEIHDIGSGAKGDATLAFATPSLRFVSGTAPYFHDGRYATLRELLHDTDGRMGDTGQLSEADLDALTAYVQSL